MIPKKSVTEALGLPNASEWLHLTGEEVEESESTEMELYSTEEDELDSDEISLEQAKAAMKQLKDMRVQLRDIPDITARKKQLDRLAEMAERKFEDIFDRAFNCEDRFASEMLNAANAMLKIALDAHAKIIDSDVKLVDIQLKKDKMEYDLNLKAKGSGGFVDPNALPGERVIAKTRNEVLGLTKSNNK